MTRQRPLRQGALRVQLTAGGVWVCDLSSRLLAGAGIDRCPGLLCDNP
jgi:hypothetical protein